MAIGVGVLNAEFAREAAGGMPNGSASPEQITTLVPKTQMNTSKNSLRVARGYTQKLRTTTDKLYSNRAL